jgi:O-antigen/teichoic acid export membrane protein
MMLTYILAAYFLPHVSENINNAEKIRAYLFHKRPRIMLFGAVCFALAWLVMPSVLNLLYHGKYSEAGGAVRIFLLGNAIFLYVAMYGPLFGALKIYKFPQIANIAQVMVSIVLSLFLIPRFGVSGAATATVISYFCLAIFFECYYRFRLRKLLCVSC